MKKFIVLNIVTLLAAVGCSDAMAQGFFEQLANKALDAGKSALERNVQRKVDQTVDNALNGNLLKKSDKNNKSYNDGVYEDQEEVATTKKKKKAQTDNVKSSFERGGQVVFEDDFSGETVGEFPSRWDLQRGAAEVGRIDGKKALMMNPDDSWVEPLINDGDKSYLGEEFTMEFDIIYPETDKNGGEFEWDFMEPTARRNDDCFTITWDARYKNNDATTYNTRWKAKDGDRRESTYQGPYLFDGEWHHIALSYNKRTLKVYVDGQRVINVPNAYVNPGWVTFLSEGADAKYITNVVIAHGTKALYPQGETDADEP